MNDLRFAFRQLLGAPGFTAVAVFTLALGIGANSAIFSVINAVLLKPLPYQQPDRIMMLWADNPSFNLGFHELPPSQRDLVDWRNQARSFEQIAGISSATIDLNQRDDSKRVGAVNVTANFFSTIGMQPMLGRTFSSDEAKPGKDKVVIVSHSLWQREFGGAANLVGSFINLNNERHAVVGVMPPGFNFPRSSEMPPPYNLPVQSDLWLPVAKDAQFWQDDLNRQFIVLGRLKPGITVPQAQSEMTSLALRVAKERPETHTGWSTQVRPLGIQVAGRTRPVLFILLGAVGFVLLIACANVANLLLCRSSARRKEMAIRAAIGAGRSRVMRQLLTESLLLALFGGVTGLLLGQAGLKVLLAFSPANIPRLHEAAFDGWVFGFSLLITLATGILFGLAPAFTSSKVNLSEVLNAAGRNNSAAGRSRSFGGIVTAEVAVAVILLVGATLMLQSFQRLLTVDTGFAKTGVYALDLTFRGVRYDKGESRIAFFRQAKERIEALPGVRGVAAISHLPLSGSENVGYFLVEGAAEPAPGQEPLAETRLATLGYFDAMGVKLIRGRDFGPTDGAGKLRVTVVNEALVRQFFPGSDPLGKRIRLKESQDWLTIVGIVQDVRGAGLDVKPRPAIYRHHSQDAGYWDEMSLVVRLAANTAGSSLESSIRHEIKAIDPTLSVANFRAMEHLVADAVSRPRFSSFLLGLFALTALALTIVGLYGVVAYTVSQRTRELGIRMALGAQRRNLLGLIVAQGMRPAVIGLIIGVAAAFGLSRFIAAQLFEIKPADPLTFIAVSILFTLVACFACWMPARRAARLDPVTALRCE